MVNDSYAHLLVKEYEHWRVYVHENQCSLSFNNT